MLVRTDAGRASILAEDGTFHDVPYEALSQQDMILQAKYHIWLRTRGYRREFICTRCQTPMESQTDANDLEDAWQLLTICSCRALYGTIPLSTLHSLIATSDS